MTAGKGKGKSCVCGRCTRQRRDHCPHGGARQGLELSVGYGSGSYERDGDFLGVVSHDVNGLQSTLSYHYRLDSMSIRGGFLTQYLILNDEIGNSVQVSVGFAGVAF